MGVIRTHARKHARTVLRPQQERVHERDQRIAEQGDGVRAADVGQHEVQHVVHGEKHDRWRHKNAIK